jgi:hypothetical protein
MKLSSSTRLLLLFFWRNTVKATQVGLAAEMHEGLAAHVTAEIHDELTGSSNRRSPV